MGIFKNDNEGAYVGGRKHWTDVIKNSGSGELLIWRQPEEDFNTNSTLIVMPGEEAIFIKGGVIEQSFDNGTYKLTTENYPFISRLRNVFSGGISTFNCVVYFIRKADSHEIFWGTQTPIQVRDKVWNIRTEAKAHGSYKVRIENPSILLLKLLGNNVSFIRQEQLDDYFENEFQGKIKSALSRFLNVLEQELIGIDAYIDELSENIMPYIDGIVSEYGLKCVKFSISGLDIDPTKYDIFDASQIELVATQRGYLGDKAGLDILGTDWARVNGMNVLKILAQNPGAGGVAATSAGAITGVVTGSVIGALAKEVFSPGGNGFPQPPNDTSVSDPSGRFTQKSAAGDPESCASNNGADVTKKLEELKGMFERNLIEEDEYAKKRAEMLSRL